MRLHQLFAELMWHVIFLEVTATCSNASMLHRLHAQVSGCMLLCCAYCCAYWGSTQLTQNLRPVVVPAFQV